MINILQLQSLILTADVFNARLAQANAKLSSLNRKITANKQKIYLLKMS